LDGYGASPRSDLTTTPTTQYSGLINKQIKQPQQQQQQQSL
jgi:hypothetical protein